MRWLLTTLLSLTLAPLSLACINFSEVNNHEQEFKSQYNLEQPAPEPLPSPEPAVEPYTMAAMGSGVAMLVGAVVVSLRRPNS